MSIRYTLFILLIYASLSNKVYSQFLTAGPKFGPQFTNIYVEDDEVESSGLLAFHAGLFTRMRISEMLGIKLEAQYSTRGANLKLRRSEVNIRSRYLELPLLLNINVMRTIYIELGPSMSYLLNGEIRDGNGSVSELELKNRPEFGFAVGIDSEIRKGLGAYLRYNIAFNQNLSREMQNQVWIQFGIKYLLLKYFKSK